MTEYAGGSIQVSYLEYQAVKTELDRLRAVNAELLMTLHETARCLEWHASRHGVGMDKKACTDARAAIANAEREVS